MSSTVWALFLSNSVVKSVPASPMSASRRMNSPRALAVPATIRSPQLRTSNSDSRKKRRTSSSWSSSDDSTVSVAASPCAWPLSPFNASTYPRVRSSASWASLP
jgi:hypothetical protein